MTLTAAPAMTAKSASLPTAIDITASAQTTQDTSQATITGISTTTTRTGSIRGSAWQDTNGDGIRQPTDPPLAGVTVQIVGTAQRAITDVRGRYRLGDVSPGSVIVQVPTAIPGFAITAPNQGDGRGTDSDFDSAGFAHVEVTDEQSATNRFDVGYVPTSTSTPPDATSTATPTTSVAPPSATTSTSTGTQSVPSLPATSATTTTTTTATTTAPAGGGGAPSELNNDSGTATTSPARTGTNDSTLPGRRLASTGADVSGTVVLGITLVVAGLLLLTLLMRRRHP
ncbi:SdrD B-like domain-containing protein [Amycolatopsis sp. NPDC049868]|uniref:SdrD B-like domain-containing protein n=1 Tax=Amycolatopsis sp. NPDC049868 TaxID=3363934 RepID=UPI00379382A4